jgi:hypothetical protein
VLTFVAISSIIYSQNEKKQMGDRFYEAQLRATGSTIGVTGKRRRKVAWDDEKRAEAIRMYEQAEPTPENSMEIVKDIAEELEESPNGVRMILTKAGVYIKKEAAAGSGSRSSKSEGSSKVSKTAAFEQLDAAIRDLGLEPNAEIIEKLTGKAALYFAEVLGSAKAA